MARFDREWLIQTFGVPDGFQPQAGFAIGRPGDPASLPQALRQRERPGNRQPLAEIAFEGSFAPN